VIEALHCGMFYMMPGVAENILLGYSEDDPQVIKYAVIQVNRGLKQRPDGSYELLMGNSASTNPALVGAEHCLSIVIKVGHD